MIGPNRLRRLIARGGGLLAATGPTTATAASPTAQPDTVQVTAVLPQILRPGADLTVTATVRNDSTTALVAPRATVRINRFRMAASSELSDWTGLSATDRTAGTAVRSVDLPGPQTSRSRCLPPRSGSTARRTRGVRAGSRSS